MKYLSLKLLLFISIESLQFVCIAQNIITIAGNGSVGDAGDGGMATIAKISEPYGCAFDSRGNFYFTEVEGNRVRKVNPSGIISTIAGTTSSGFSGDGGPATLAELNDPTGIAVDTLNNIFIVDKLNQRIRKIDALTGIITTIAGNGIAGYGGDSVVADTTMLNAPQDICFDHFGNLYLCDDGNYMIRKISTFGIISKIGGNGTHGYTGDGGLANTAEMQGMTGICIDSIGEIFFAQYTNYIVRKINTAGIISTIAGNGLLGSSGDGLPATAASLNAYRLALDDTGNLYVSCYLNDDIRKIDLLGIMHTVAGTGISGYYGDGGSADTAELHIPIGIAFDQCGNLYIADQDNDRIRKVGFYPFCSLDSLDSIATLSINKINNNTTIITIYPNPATNELTITSNTQINKITITNLIGQTMASPRPSPRGEGVTTLKVDISGLPEGVYMVAVIDEEGNKVVRKIIKE